MNYLKNTSLFILLFSIAIQCSFAQNQLFEKKLYSSTWQSVIHEVIPADSASWIVAGYVGDCDNGFLARIDSSGEIVWEKFLGGYSQFTVVIALSDGNYLAAGNKLQADDVISEDDVVVLLKFDINGNTLFESSDTTIYPGATNMLAEVGVDRIFLVREDTLSIFSATGDSLGEEASLIGAYHDIVADENRLLAGTEAGVATLDSNGNLTQFVPYLSPVKNVGLVGDTAYIIGTETSLIVLGKGLEDTILVKNLSSQFSEINEMVVNDQYYFIHGIDASGNESLMHIYDIEHNLKFTLSGGFDDYIEYGKIALADSIFAVTGNDALSPGGHAYIKTIDYNLNASVHNLDIGISNLVLSSLTKEFDNVYTTGNGVQDSFFFYDFSYSVDVENLGTDTVDYFYLQSGRIGGVNCAVFNIRRRVDSTLYPGELMTIEDIRISVTQKNTSFNVCFYVLSPNDLMDSDKSNNSTCNEVILTIPEVISEQNVSITPNPFSEFIQLQTDVKLDYLEIYNAAGRSVLEESNLQNSHQISTEQLPAGIYILKAGNGESAITRKMVKVE